MSNQNISEQIKQARKRAGLTQQDLANETGLSLRTIQRIEKGDQEVSGYSLRQISAALEVPLEQLILPNVNQVRIETSSVSAVKALYLSSLLFVINPLLGIIVPAILSYSRPYRDAFYKKHFRFMITYFVILNIVVYGLIVLFALNAVLRISRSETLLSFIFRFQIPAILFYYVGTIALMLYRFFTLRSRSSEAEQATG
ncbi:MAG: hypothetical protein ABS46_05400 [Cytophagaceae bacterium SCN 52-12]|nr:MAG: hypothetical protein ABS46_05400 [Cytophagaceae bacterium SCN 52-12]